MDVLVTSPIFDYLEIKNPEIPRIFSWHSYWRKAFSELSINIECSNFRKTILSGSYDLILFLDSAPVTSPKLDKLDGFKIWYFNDSHLHAYTDAIRFKQTKAHLALVRNSFDIKVLSTWIPSKHLIWMPFGIDTHLFKPQNEEEIYDIVFSGRLGANYTRRKKLLEALSRNFKCKFHILQKNPLRPYQNGAFGAFPSYLKLLNSSKLLFSCASDFGDLAFRPFECLAVAKCTLIDNIIDACRLFSHKENAVFYFNEEDLVTKVETLLAEPIIRKQIGLKGRRYIEEFHSIKHRVSEIIEMMP